MARQSASVYVQEVAASRKDASDGAVLFAKLFRTMAW
jgi:hypothetical protein